MKTELTPENLKQALWETLQGVKNKKMKPVEANSIAYQARAMCAIAKLQLEYHRSAGSKPNPQKLLG